MILSKTSPYPRIHCRFLSTSMPWFVTFLPSKGLTSHLAGFSTIFEDSSVNLPYLGHLDYRKHVQVVSLSRRFYFLG